MKQKSGYLLVILGVILMFLFSSFNSIIGFITDYKWFSELGYTETFLKKLTTLFKIGVPIFIILFIVLTFYLRLIKKKYYKIGNVIPDKRREKITNRILALVSFILSIFVSSNFANNLWFEILQFKNSTEFKVLDPIFNKDISFYIFKLPLIREIMSLIFSLLFILIVITVIFYVIMIVIKNQGPNGLFDMDELSKRRDVSSFINKDLIKSLIVQIGVFGFIIFVMIGISYVLRSYDLLYSTRGKVYGASYTDIKITLLFYRVSSIVAILSAFLVLIGAVRRNAKIALAGPVLIIIVSIVSGITSGTVQSLVVEPNEISKELQYLEYNIDYTQKAYGLGIVEEKQFAVEQNLTKDDILNNEETIKNIRINDYRPINQVYNQIQGIRLYYEFNDIDIDRYNIDGKYTQVFLSARELNQNKLNEKAKTWINQHLKYTHGYGLALSPVNSITKEGQPELLVKNIPPTTNTDLKINRPEIYFGESTNDYVIVNTNQKEFDYPAGENNKESIYEGNAGIKLDGMNKLLFAIKQGSMKMMLSSDITSDSKIILYRNVKERVEKIAPFIAYDDDPYLVINNEDGNLYWIIDGYTMSERYPYSQPYKNTNVNYIRNSVKVVMDAYNGDTKYYVFDETDPVIMTYKKIFPDLFMDKDDMPKGIKEHTRYPQMLFDIQSEVYKVYHINNPEVFYNREDVWDIAKEKYMAGEQNIESNYVMFKLPDEEKEEFLLTVPYTPSQKNNMTALFVARNDGDNYGKLFIYKLPKQKTIEGPMMIETRIDQDSTISPQLTLWGQKGSEVLRGNLLVIPVENSLLYVEPIYLKADNENSLPEVKRVIVAYKDKIVMEETLELALSKIFGETTPTTPVGDKDDADDTTDINIEDSTVNALIIEANDLFTKSKEASRNGEWSKYGEYIDRLEQILNKLNDYTNEDVTDTEEQGGN